MRDDSEKAEVSYILSQFTPYRVCPLGAHVDHQHGLVTGFALDRGVNLRYKETNDGKVELKSKNYKGKVSFYMSDIPERSFLWGDFVLGAVKTLQRKYSLKKGIEGVIEGTLPVGGLSSSAAVIITYLQALCKVNGIHLTQNELIQNAIWEEKNYIGVNVGSLDQSCEVYAKEDHLLYLDTRNDSAELIPVSPKCPLFEIAIIFSGIEHKLSGSSYNARVDECKAAAYALKAFCGQEYGRFEESYLREVPQGIFENYKYQLPCPWYKRATHFYSENRRVREGITAWRKGDLNTFGKLMFESGHSSIYEYETGSEELKSIYNIMLHTDGIYGGRFSGAGFNGCSIAIINPEKKEHICNRITEEYLEKYPQLEDKFSIHFCKTADGVNLV